MLDGKITFSHFCEIIYVVDAFVLSILTKYQANCLQAQKTKKFDV